MQLDIKVLAAATATIVREHVDAIIQPFEARLAALEQRQPERGEKGDVGDRGEAGPGPDMEVVGRSIADAVASEVAAAIAALLPPERGEKGATGDRGEPGEAGPAPDMDAVQRTITDAVAVQVAAAVAALPPAERGEKGDPGERGELGQKGENGQNGKDGAGVADLLIDREGALVATMTDGRMKSLGCVIGKDGADGCDGVDGKAGMDGRDGIGPDDIELEVLEDDRTVRFTATRDGESKSFDIPFPIVIDRGEHEAGKSYAEADMVSRDGALWIARVATSSEPGMDAADWRCAVRKGEPGKDAYVGEARGLYDPVVTYRALDVVSHNGSEWRAKHDYPGELPGAGWMLSASKGKRGDKGDRGKDAGEGAGLVAGYVDRQSSELVLTKADGDEIKIDLRDLAQLLNP